MQPSDIDPTVESDDNAVDSMSDSIIRFGLSGNLWRVAIVIGIAQFSTSLWSWQFGIFLADVVERWQIGLTFSIGTFAMILGYLASGTISDYIGRKNALSFAFLPIIVGLVALRFFPIWPLIPIEYAVYQFGWAFVIVISRAVPADEMAMEGETSSARTFMMVLLPALLVDGAAPIAAGILLSIGYVAGDINLLAAIGALVALIATNRGVRESLGSDVIQKAKEGSVITLRGLGRNFWIFSAGMIGLVFIMSLAFPYMGNLVVGEWGIDESIYAFAWAANSLTSVIVMYSVGTAADKNIRIALIAATWSISVIVGIFAMSSAVWQLFLLNIVWSFPMVIWIGSENTFAVNGVSDQMKGRALGTYQVLMSSARIIAAFLGGVLWEITGSLRTVWSISSIGALIFVVVLTFAVMSISFESDTQKTETLMVSE